MPGAESELGEIEVRLSNFTKTQIDSYSDSIRNLGIISGVVSPLSLTLLSVQSLNTNTPMLLSGFVALLINIPISYFFLHKELDIQNSKLKNAMAQWAMATNSSLNYQNEREDAIQKLSEQFDYLERVNKINHFLTAEKLNVDLIKTVARLKNYSRATNALFALGCVLVILSIIC